jgi:hypothetical protein
MHPTNSRPKALSRYSTPQIFPGSTVPQYLGPERHSSSPKGIPGPWILSPTIGLLGCWDLYYFGEQ